MSFSSGDKNHFFLRVLGGTWLKSCQKTSRLIRDTGNPGNILCWGGQRGWGAGVSIAAHLGALLRILDPENDSEFMRRAPQSWGLRKRGVATPVKRRRRNIFLLESTVEIASQLWDGFLSSTKPLYNWNLDPGMVRSLGVLWAQQWSRDTLCIELLRSTE